jgi:hypothetical protein
VVTLTLDSPHEEAAALAILEAMYGVKPIPQILSESPCTQQLDIAVLADKLHLPAICTPAVHGLLAACKGSQVSAAAVAQHLASKQHIPGCLLPLVRQLFSSYDAAKDAFPVEALQQVSYCCSSIWCGNGKENHRRAGWCWWLTVGRKPAWSLPAVWLDPVHARVLSASGCYTVCTSYS